MECLRCGNEIKVLPSSHIVRCDCGYSMINLNHDIKRTICDIVGETKILAMLEGDNAKRIKSNLDEIQERAMRMEERLTQYRNAIEELGYIREELNENSN